jgi:putative membrane protein
MNLLLSHDGRSLAPHHLWHAWSFEPLVVGALILSAGLYMLGLGALWGAAGTGHGIRRWQAGAFAGGWSILAIALLSPLHRLGGVLFSAHMVQHELLMVVAAPLLVLGRPVVAWLWGVPLAWRQRLGVWSAAAPVRYTWELATLPSVAWALHALAIWLWHAPGLYQATLDSELVHSLQHTSFLGSALLFWWALLPGRRGRLGAPAGIVYLFTTAIHTTLLGALLTLSSRVWYPLYDNTTAPWGLTALEDQQLAGLIMWVPAGLAYLVAALALAASWLRDPKPRMVTAKTIGAALTPLVILGALLTGCNKGAALSKPEAARLTGGSPDHGATVIRNYGCGSCHTIPGIRGADALVGPPLAGIGGRSYIAGVLTNSPHNLTRWIQHPQEVDPLTAMPDLGVSESDARDIAAYLYTRK